MLDPRTGDTRAASVTDAPIDWSCPACGASGTVEAIDDVDCALKTIKARHNLISPDCLNSRHDLDVVA
jgi:hypothetical protein